MLSALLLALVCSCSMMTATQPAHGTPEIIGTWELEQRLPTAFWVGPLSERLQPKADARQPSLVNNYRFFETFQANGVWASRGCSEDRYEGDESGTWTVRCDTPRGCVIEIAGHRSSEAKGCGELRPGPFTWTREFVFESRQQLREIGGNLDGRIYMRAAPSMMSSLDAPVVGKPSGVRVLRVETLQNADTGVSKPARIVLHAGTRHGVQIDDAFFLGSPFRSVRGLVTDVDETACVIEVPRPDAWFVPHIRVGDLANRRAGQPAWQRD
jgi:hypothetical protein